MPDRWEWIINNSKLEIVDFDIHTWEAFQTPERVFPFYVMSYIKEGAAEADIGGEKYRSDAGSLLLLPPGGRHFHYIPPDAGRTTFLWWHFTLTIAEEVDILRLMNLPVRIEVKNTIAFEDVFYQYVSLYKRKLSVPNLILRRAKGLELMAYLFENIMQFQENLPECFPQNIPDEFFEMLMSIVDCPENKLCLKSLSDRYFMNKTYISNRFKAHFGISPVKLQHSLLHKKAQTILVTGNQSIGDIAHSLGFQDLSTFTRFFTEREGCSPKEYREINAGSSLFKLD